GLRPRTRDPDARAAQTASSLYGTGRHGPGDLGRQSGGPLAAARPADRQHSALSAQAGADFLRHRPGRIRPAAGPAAPALLLPLLGPRAVRQPAGHQLGVVLAARCAARTALL